MTEFGKSLRDAREAKGYSIGQLAEITRMAPSTIENLENEDFSRIAAPIYGRGFVKLYCEAVELDPKPFIGVFMEMYDGNHQTGIRSRPAKRREPPAIIDDTPSADAADSALSDFGTESPAPVAASPSPAPLPPDPLPRRTRMDTPATEPLFAPPPMPEPIPEPPPMPGFAPFSEPPPMPSPNRYAAPAPQHGTPQAAASVACGSPTNAEPTPPASEAAEQQPNAAAQPKPSQTISRYAAPMRQFRTPSVPASFWRIGVLAVVALVILALIICGLRALYHATTSADDADATASADAVAAVETPAPAMPTSVAPANTRARTADAPPVASPSQSSPTPAAAPRTPQQIPALYID